MRLGKGLRYTILAVLIIVISCLTFFIIRGMTVNSFKEEKIQLFNCENKGNILQEIYLKPNSIFDEKILDNDKIVLTEYVDHISTTCNYEFSSDKKADISGQYEIVALVEGYTSEDGQDIIIWSKAFELYPETGFEKKDADSFLINRNVNINLSEYNDFVIKISEETKISLSARLIISLNVDINVETEEGIIEEKISPNLVIPLGTRFFKVSGTLEETKSGVIEKTINVPVPRNYGLLYTLIVLDVILIIGLVYTLFFTHGLEPDPTKKLLCKIFNRHGDRMVAIKSEFSKDYENKYEVASMEDLVRISDEIEKPIMYQYDEHGYLIPKFYVINGHEMYYYSVEDESITPENSISNPASNGLEVINALAEVLE